MRKIKFRGKPLESNHYVYGGFYKITSEKITQNYIINEKTGKATEVDFTTVDQFVGLYDVNKNEVYSGDKCIVTIKEYNYKQDNKAVETKVYCGFFEWTNEEGPYFTFFNRELNCRCSIGIFDLYCKDFTIELLNNNNNNSYSNNSEFKNDEEFNESINNLINKFKE